MRPFIVCFVLEIGKGYVCYVSYCVFVLGCNVLSAFNVTNKKSGLLQICCASINIFLSLLSSQYNSHLQINFLLIMYKCKGRTKILEDFK